MALSVVVEDKEIMFDVKGNSLIVQDYNLENELIAAKLSNQYSLTTIFLLGSDALLKEIGEKEFNKQYQILKSAWIERAEKDVSNENLLNLYYALQESFMHTRLISSPGVLHALSKIAFAHTREDVAYNQYTRGETLALMSNDPSIRVLERLCENPNTPQSTLANLAHNESLLAMIMDNAQTPEYLHLRYANDENWFVRMNIAENTANIQLMQQYATDDHSFVRSALGRNPHLPKEILEVLLNDSNEQVSTEAIEKIENNAAKELNIKTQQAIVDSLKRQDSHEL